MIEDPQQLDRAALQALWGDSPLLLIKGLLQQQSRLLIGAVEITVLQELAKPLEPLHIADEAQLLLQAP